MKTLWLCLVLLVVGCGSIHGTLVGDTPKDLVVFDYTGTADGAHRFAEAAQARVDAKTHRLAVKNAGELAMVYAEQGMPANIHEQGGEVDASGGYNMNMYGMPGMPGTYGMSNTAAIAQAASLGYGRGALPQIADPSYVAQPGGGQTTPLAICPKDRVAATDPERIACLHDDRKAITHRLSKVEKVLTK